MEVERMSADGWNEGWRRVGDILEASKGEESVQVPRELLKSLAEASSAIDGQKWLESSAPPLDGRTHVEYVTGRIMDITDHLTPPTGQVLNVRRSDPFKEPPHEIVMQFGRGKVKITIGRG